MSPRPASRFEIKYLIPRELRVAVIRSVRAYARPDRHARGDGFYRVRSLYFDTSRHLAYHEKMDGLLYRGKFRIRTYGDGSEVLFLEYKQRFNNRILKRRDALSRDDYETLLRGVQLRGEGAGNAWEAFWYHNALAHLKPVLCIDYKRKSFVGTLDRRLRVTLDEKITVCRARGLEERRASYPVLSGDHCVLEIKFNHYCPVWVNRLVRAYSLQDQAYSKYCMGLETLVNRGAHHLG